VRPHRVAVLVAWGGGPPRGGRACAAPLAVSRFVLCEVDA
jgi:hypothetical protein